MNLYAILRRNGWRSPEELQEAAARSARVGDEDMPEGVRWIRSTCSRKATALTAPSAYTRR